MEYTSHKLDFISNQVNCVIIAALYLSQLDKVMPEFKPRFVAIVSTDEYHDPLMTINLGKCIDIPSDIKEYFVDTVLDLVKTKPTEPIAIVSIGIRTIDGTVTSDTPEDIQFKRRELWADVAFINDVLGSKLTKKKGTE